MSGLAVGMPFDFSSFPSASIRQPSPPTQESMAGAFMFDPSFYSMPYGVASVPSGSTHSHSRSSSRASVYSAATIESTPESLCSRLSTPPRASPPIRQHGPILLPKIRPQDQEIDSTPYRGRTLTPQAPQAPRARHVRSYTSPETLHGFTYESSPCALPLPSTLAHSFSPAPEEPASLLNSPAPFALHADNSMSRRASSCSTLDAATIEKYGYPTYRQMPSYMAAEAFPSNYSPRAPSPLSQASTPDPVQTTTLMDFLTVPNPAASLVRTISFPLRDPNSKHFWWDIRNVRSWTGFNASTIYNLPGADAILNMPVPAPMLPQPSFSSRHPETEAALHSIYANFYLPKLNAALNISSTQPLQLSVPSRKTNPVAGAGPTDLLFVANAPGEAATAAAMFGGKPSARVVGIVRSFDRFNTGMRAEGNIKRVEYLRGLTAIHHAMREHGCRYGFILTEIELVVVRNGTEHTPFFGDIEIASIQLATAASDVDEAPLTACLALWGLCQMASDETPMGQACWRAEIGAPAEGTRRKAQPRDSWIPQPQLAEKREAKRSRGWVWPEDAIGRKELGKRGVRYNGI